jgi:hypothetical protein
MGPSRLYITEISFVVYSIVELGILGFMPLAVSAVGQRRLVRRGIWGGLGLLALVLLGLQIASIPAINTDRWADYVLYYLLYDITVGGAVLTGGLVRTGRRRLPGGVLWGTGLFLSGATLWYVIQVFGTDGLYEQFLYTGVGVYTMLGAAGFCLIGGALTTAWEPSLDNGRQTVVAGVESVRRLPLAGGSLPVIGGIAVSLLGASLGWTVGNTAFRVAVDSMMGHTVQLALAGLIATIAFGGVVLSMHSDWSDSAGLLISLGGLGLVALPLFHTWASDSAVMSPGLALTAGGGGVVSVTGIICLGLDYGLLSDSSDAGPFGVSSGLSTATVLIAVPGMMLVSLGTTFDWVVPSTTTGSAGTIDTIGGLALPVLALGLVLGGSAVSAVVWWLWSDTAGGLILFATGSAIASVPILWLVGTVGPDSMIGDRLLVAPGAYLTLGGAGLLVIAGGLYSQTSVVRSPPASESRTEDTLRDEADPNH